MVKIIHIINRIILSVFWCCFGKLLHRSFLHQLLKAWPTLCFTHLYPASKETGTSCCWYLLLVLWCCSREQRIQAWLLQLKKSSHILASHHFASPAWRASHVWMLQTNEFVQTTYGHSDLASPWHQISQYSGLWHYVVYVMWYGRPMWYLCGM